jgi:hypothetical protein
LKKLFLLSSILLSIQSFSYELDEIYYFPKKSSSELTFTIALKEFEIEYEESSSGISGNDIQEFDQQVLIARPSYKYSFTDRFLVEAGFSYQGKDLNTYFEDYNDNQVPTSSERGLYDPRVELRYRIVKKNTVFLDALIDQTFKTNTYVEGNRSRIAKPYSGQYTTTLATEIGYKFKRIMLKTYLNISFLTGIEKQLTVLDDVFKADFTYSVGFGGEILIRATENFNLSFGFTSVSVNAYDMKSQLNKVHTDKVLTAIIAGKIEYKRFQSSIGSIVLGYGVDTTKNRLTYNDSQNIISETQSLLTTLGIKKRF